MKKLTVKEFANYINKSLATIKRMIYSGNINLNYNIVYLKGIHGGKKIYIIVDDTVTNDTVINDIVINDTVTNDIVTNDIVINDTVINDTVINDTVINDTLVDKMCKLVLTEKAKSNLLVKYTDQLIYEQLKYDGVKYCDVMTVILFAVFTNSTLKEIYLLILTGLLQKKFKVISIHGRPSVVILKEKNKFNFDFSKI